MYDPGERGVAMGASVGRPELQALLDVGHLRATTGRADAFLCHPPAVTLTDDQNVPLSAMARMMSATGPMIGISTACSGSGHAIGEAYRAIQEGDARLMVAGGYDSLTTWLDLLGFSLLGALTDRHNDDPEHASRPFDADRSGFVIGEGAVAVVLEDLDAARERGAPVLGEVLGYGSTLNAWRITDSPPDGSGAVQAMEAIGESGLGAAGIDYVVAHGPAPTATTSPRRSPSRRSSPTTPAVWWSAPPSRWPATSPPPAWAWACWPRSARSASSWSRPPSTSSGPTAAWTSTTCHTPPARCRWRRP